MSTESSTPGLAILWEWPMLWRIATIEGHELPVWKAVFSPDDRWLVTVGGGGFDGFENARKPTHNRGEVRLWDPHNGGFASPFRLGVSGDCRAVAFSPDSTILAVSEDAQRLTRFTRNKFDRFTPLYRIKLWRIEDGRIKSSKGTKLTSMHTHAIQDIAFTPDGKTIVSGARDETARLWDVASEKPTGTLGGHDREAAVVVPLPDGERILTGDRKGWVRFWPLRVDESRASRTQEIPGRFANQEDVRSIGFSADGSRTFLLHEVRGWTVWEHRVGIQTSPQWGSLGRQTGDELIFTGTVSPDGTKLFSSRGTTSHIRDARTGELLVEFGTRTSYPGSARYSPDGKRLAIGGSRELMVWSLDGAEPRKIAAFDHGDYAHSLDWSPDGEMIAYGLRNQTAGLLAIPGNASPAGGDPVSLKPQRTFDSDAVVYYVAFLGDRNRLAYGASAGSRIVDTRSGAEVGNIVGGVLAVSPDRSRMLVSSSPRGAPGSHSFVYDVASLKRMQGSSILDGFDVVINIGAFSPDGRYVVAGSPDGTAALYDLVEKKHVWYKRN